MTRSSARVLLAVAACSIPSIAAADEIRLLRATVNATAQIGYEYPGGTNSTETQSYDGPAFVGGVFQPVLLFPRLRLDDTGGELSAFAGFNQRQDGGLTEFTGSTSTYETDLHPGAPATKESRVALDWTFRVFGTNTYMDFFAEAYPSDLLGLTLYDETAAVMVGRVQPPRLGAAFDSVQLDNGHTYRLRGIATSTFGADPFALFSFTTNADVTPPVPEPATLGLLGTGVAVLLRARRRQNTSRQDT